MRLPDWQECPDGKSHPTTKTEPTGSASNILSNKPADWEIFAYGITDGVSPAFPSIGRSATILRMNKPRVATIAICILLACVAGCERASEPAGLPQSRFIEVMVALRKAAQGVRDSAEFAAKKEQVLTAAGVTEQQLRAYLEAHIRDLDHLAAVWESINVRLADEPLR